MVDLVRHSMMGRKETTRLVSIISFSRNRYGGISLKLGKLHGLCMPQSFSDK